MGRPVLHEVRRGFAVCDWQERAPCEKSQEDEQHAKRFVRMLICRFQRKFGTLRGRTVVSGGGGLRTTTVQGPSTRKGWRIALHELQSGISLVKRQVGWEGNAVCRGVGARGDKQAGSAGSSGM